jgi:starch synthase
MLRQKLQPDPDYCEVLMGLKILVAASEAAPFAKEGGLADVVGALPRYMAGRGHDVKVVMPRYYKVDREKFDLQLLPGVLTVPMGIIGTMYCGVYEGRMPGSEVPVYFLEHEEFYGRDNLYEQDNESFLDNDNRFIFLSRATLEICRMLDFRPDVIHVHDWHTAAVPVLLNTAYRHDPYVEGAASLLTIHNMQHQGSFYPGAMDVLGIGWEHFTFLGLEKDSQVNLLKGGIYHATLLNTVSSGYAREMQSAAFGWGLEGVVRERSADLTGILNGVDYTEWNPETDPLIPANYSSADLSGKGICKRELQRELGLPERSDVPLIGMVSRLVKQKGIDVLAQAIPRILDLEVQFVMLGAGEPWAHFFFGDIAAANPDKFRCVVGFNNPLAHRIEAGADFFLMPSAFEPCGLNQMYSMRYGTLPIVSATGGLDDSVDNFDQQTMTGTGFKFNTLNAGALFDTIGWGVHTWYHHPAAIKTLIQQAMAKRFTWDEAAEKYEELYLKAIHNRHGEDRLRHLQGHANPAPEPQVAGLPQVSLILAHPDKGSFNHSIAATAADRLRSNGYRVNFHDLYAEGFDPILPHDEIPTRGSVPPVVAQHCREIAAAAGIIIIHPNWWGQPPAILKGWIDRVIRPEVAYRFKEGDSGQGVPEGLLQAETALIFNTSNTEAQREQQVFGDPLKLIWKNCIFELCGVKNIQREMFGVMVTSSPEQRLEWLSKVRQTVDQHFPAVPAAG